MQYDTATYEANFLAAAAAAHAAQTAAAISAQSPSSKLLDTQRGGLSNNEENDDIVDDDRVEVDSTVMDCLQCQTMVKRKSSNGKMVDTNRLQRSEVCSIHNTSVEGVTVGNSLNSKPPPALKFSVSAILARAAQAGSIQTSSISNVGPFLADNDSLSEDTDHAGSEGTGASSDHDNLQSHIGRNSQDPKQQGINNSSSPCPHTSASSSHIPTAASMAISAHPYMLSPSLTAAMSGAGSLAKPVPRPLGSSPLFNGGTSPLQTLLYRHPYLAASGRIISINNNDT